MKVANITEEGRWGGPQARIVAVAERLRALGIETTVIYPDSASEVLRGRLAELGLIGVALPLARPTKGGVRILNYLVRFLPQTLRLAWLLRRGRFDLVHCNGPWQIKGAIAARLAGVRIVWHLNDTYSPRIVRDCFRVIAHLCADGFIVAGERVAACYLKGSGLAHRPCVEIQAPVDTTRFDPATVIPDPVVAALPGIKVVTIANLNPAKDYETFVRMCAGVNRQSSAEISFVGAGAVYETQVAYADEIRRLAEELGVSNLHLIGHVSDVASVLRAADVYVCSSRFEASPISVWEAMSMALPVVSTDVGDVRRFLDQSEAGHVVAAGDHTALATRVAMLVTDRVERIRLGALARDLTCRTFDLEQCAERHADCYRLLGPPTLS